MRDNLRIEVKGTIGGLFEKENIGELIFDFYDHHNYHLGNVLVDAKGRLTWSIWNDNYEKDILELVSKINGYKVNDTIQSKVECLSEKNFRWNNAIKIVEENNIEISYNQNPIYNEEKIHSAK